MSIEPGMKYQISQNIKGNFNSADALTIINNNGVTVQFALDEGKGRGAMPLEYLCFLVKKENLILIAKSPNKRLLLKVENNEEKIG